MVGIIIIIIIIHYYYSNNHGWNNNNNVEVIVSLLGGFRKYPTLSTILLLKRCLLRFSSSRMQEHGLQVIL
jgi:hypothetical protein